MALEARQWLEKIRRLPLPGRVRIMNVCGGHERSITMAGLRGALPPEVELIPGPGCPVCVCPEEDVHQAIQLALKEDVILLAFGDMLRVPVNVPKKEARSLEQAKAQGADIRPIASPLEAVAIARQNPNRPVVFFAAGFETTTAPVAGMLAEGVPDNLFVLLAGRLTWPAVAMLLQADKPGFDALVAPGHVSTVMGPEDGHLLGPAPAHRGTNLSRQLLFAGGTAWGQSRGKKLARRDDAHRRRQLAGGRHDSALRLRATGTFRGP